MKEGETEAQPQSSGHLLLLPAMATMRGGGVSGGLRFFLPTMVTTRGGDASGGLRFLMAMATRQARVWWWRLGRETMVEDEQRGGGEAIGEETGAIGDGG